MADLEDLKQVWQSQSGISQQRFNQIGVKVHDGSRQLQATIFRRDMVETCASIAVVVVFAYFLSLAKNWTDGLGFAVVVIAAITIPIVLWAARRRDKTVVSAANFRDYLQVEIAYLRRQVRLLRSVGWWYLLPLYVGLALIMFGMTGPSYTTGEWVILGICMVINTALFIYLWWINQSARKRHLEPLLEYYVQMQAALDNGDDEVFAAGPPTEFLTSPIRKPMTGRARWVWIAMTAFAAGSVIGAGMAIRQSFDSRAGGFVISTAPVVAILFVFISGIWRPSAWATATNNNEN